MKNKKVIGLGLIGVFILLSSKAGLATNEVEIKSIICPSSIKIGIKDENGNLIEIKTLSFEEYLKGVVYAEMWLAGIRSENALKSQAIAARTYAVKHMGKTYRRRIRCV